VPLFAKLLDSAVDLDQPLGNFLRVNSPSSCPDQFPGLRFLQSHSGIHGDVGEGFKPFNLLFSADPLPVVAHFTGSDSQLEQVLCSYAGRLIASRVDRTDVLLADAVVYQEESMCSHGLLVFLSRGLFHK